MNCYRLYTQQIQHLSVMEAKELQEVYDSLSSNPTKKIIGDQETDDDFLDDIFAIAEHSETIQKEFLGRRSQLSQEEYQFVERTGKLHYKCQMFNQTHLMIPGDIPASRKCKCGCNKAYGEPLPFCLNQQEATFIGPGVILFLYYTKMLFLLVFILIVIFGTYSVVTNIMIGNHHSDCSSPGALAFLCEIKIVTSLENKDGRDDLLIGQLILGFVACFVWSLAIRVIRAIGRRKNKQIDDYLDSSADNCVLIDNLPEGDYSERQILQYMQKRWNDSQKLNKFPLKIRGVQIVYNMEKVRRMIEKIHELSRRIVGIVDKVTNSEGQKQYIIKKGFKEPYQNRKQQVLHLYQKLKSFRHKFWHEEEFRHWLSAGVALVEFEESGQQEQFLQIYGTDKKTVLKEIIRSFKGKYLQKVTEHFQGQMIKIVKAPEPSDIFWDHCEKRVEKKRVFAVWIINLVLMGCSFGAQMIVRQIKLANPDVSELGIVSIVTLNLFNRFIWNILLTIVFIEKNHTKTDNITSVMNKSYISQVMNIILIPIILNLVLADKLDGPSGLAGSIHDYQITAFFFMMIFNFVNFPHLFLIVFRNVKCIRRLVIRFYCRVTGDLDTYDEMRDALVFLYTPPNPPLAGFYVYITTVISQAAFFCHLMPVILGYLLASILLFHLINRYIILKRCKIPDLIDFVVFETCCGFAMNVPLLYAVGSIMILALRDGPPNFGYYVPSILCIVVWILSTQSPFGLYQKMTNCIVDTFFPQKFDKQDQEMEMNLIQKVMNYAKKQSKKKKERVVTKRKQNYHANCTTTLIFNMESQLQEVAGIYHNKSKQFCHQFTLNMEEKGESIKQPSIDQNITSIKKFTEQGSSTKKLMPEDDRNQRISLSNIKFNISQEYIMESQQKIKEMVINDENEQQKDEKKKGSIFQQHSDVFNKLFGK